MLVEEQVPIAHEMYAAVLNDPASKGPLLLFSAQGGMDIEEIAEKHPDALLRLPVDIRNGLDLKGLERALPAAAAVRPRRARRPARAGCTRPMPPATPS